MKDIFDDKRYSEIEGDKFSEVVGDKLRTLGEEPPQGMFERIEQTLHAMEVAEPKRVVPLWSRPFVRGAVAAMAAAMLALVVVVALRENAPEEIRVVAEMQNEELPTPAQPTQSETPEPQKVAVATTMVKSPAASVKMTAGERNESLAEVVEVEAVVAEQEQQIATENESRVEEAQQPTKRENKKSVRTTSSRQNQQELEEYWRVALSEKSKPKSILSSAKVGVYAQNVGVNYGHIVLDNLANSSMIVREQNDISTGSSYMPPAYAQQAPNSKLEHFMPITAGITVSFALNDWLSVDSGLLYTNVYSTGDNEGSMSVYARRRTLDYLGVPVAASLYFADFNRLSFYGRLGGTVELCINAKDKTYIDGKLDQKESIKLTPLTFSLDAAMGATYALWGSVGLFGELGCSYWIAPNGYVENYRTVHPLSLSTRMGVRFAFN